MDDVKNLESWFSENRQIIMDLLATYKTQLENLTEPTSEQLLELAKQFINEMPGSYGDLIETIEEQALEHSDRLITLMSVGYSQLPQGFFSDNSIQKIDQGDTRETARLLASVLATLPKSNVATATCPSETQLQAFFERIHGPITQNIARVFLCIHLGIPNTARSTLSFLLTELFKRLHPQSVRRELIEYEGSKKHLSKASKKGADARWNKKKEIKRFALELRNSKTYKNDSQATGSLLNDITEYAKSIGEPFTSEHQAHRTIYRWFRDAAKAIG